MTRTTQNPQGLLLDMDGVFYVGDTLLTGARETLLSLREQAIPFRFITNTTTRSPASLLKKLHTLGLPAEEDELFTAITATREYLQRRGRPTCHFLVRDAIRPCFSEFEQNDHDPDYVIIGDIGAAWDYETLNALFNMLMRGARLLCMHRNRYWQDADGLRMDIGAFVAALEYVSGQQAVVIGKPSPAFFQTALAALGLPAESVAIVGDDIESDIGGGQSAGLQGILVKTGKYREELVNRSSVRPDALIDSIAALPGLLRQQTV